MPGSDTQPAPGGPGIPKDVPPVTERITRYAYLHNDVPEDDEAAFMLTVYVEWRGGNRWAITRSGRRCMSWSGAWDFESGDRSDLWLDRHRFDLNDAREAAAKAAVRVYEEWQTRKARLNGLRATQEAQA